MSFLEPTIHGFKVTKPKVNKFDPIEIGARKQRGKFYNISFVEKKKKGVVKTERSKTEISPNIFAPSHSTILRDTNGNWDYDNVFYFDVENMACGKIHELKTAYNSLGVNLDQENLVSIFDFTPYQDKDQGGAWIFPDIPRGTAAYKFVVISRTFLNTDGARKKKENDYIEQLVNKNSSFYSDLWKGRSVMIGYVSTARKQELFKDLIKKTDASSASLNTNSFIALDVSKYGNIAQDGIGKIRERTVSQGKTPVYRDGLIINPAPDGIYYSAGVVVSDTRDVRNGTNDYSFLVVSKSRDSYRRFLADYIELTRIGLNDADMLQAKENFIQKNFTGSNLIGNLFSGMSIASKAAKKGKQEIINKPNGTGIHSAIVDTAARTKGGLYEGEGEAELNQQAMQAMQAMQQDQQGIGFSTATGYDAPGSNTSETQEGSNTLESQEGI